MFPQTSSRTVALITAPILAICLTACGYFPKTSAEAAPPASPSPSASPTPDPEALKVKDTWTDVELPTQPDLSDESLQGGASAAAYYLRLFWHAAHTRDYEAIRHHIIPGSKAETLTRLLINKYTQNDYIFEGDEITEIHKIALQQEGPQDYIYAVDVSFSPSKVAIGNREKFSTNEGGRDYFVITMKYVENTWKLDAVHHGTLTN